MKKKLTEAQRFFQDSLRIHGFSNDASPTIPPKVLVDLKRGWTNEPEIPTGSQETQSNPALRRDRMITSIAKFLFFNELID